MQTKPEPGISRSAFLTTRAAESCQDMLKSLQLCDARLAHEPTAITRGVRRELDRVARGLEAVRDFLQYTINKIFREIPDEFSREERADFPKLLELIRKHPSANWPTLAERLAKLPGASPSWDSMPRDRVVLAALAAAGAPRYAIGTPVDPTSGEDGSAGVRLYDLYDLPPSVGAQSGFAPIVRAALDGTVRFGSRFRFAKPSDQLLGHSPLSGAEAEGDDEAEVV